MGIPKSLSILLVVSIIGKFLFFMLSIESVRTGFSLPISEAWKDYAYAYVPTVQAFKEGYLPYRDFFHAYPPLFLYALTLFSFLPYIWSMALPLVISDALTVMPVYLVGKRLLSERYAFITSLLFALAPINLFYVDYVRLNPPMATLFLMASIYFLLARRYDFSAFTLAISIGFKQTSLLALPLVLLFLAKKLSHKMALRYFVIIASVCFAFSIPYILVEPRLYLYSIFRVPISSWGELPENYFQLGFTNPPGSTTIDTATLDWYELKWMKYVPLNAPASLSLPIFIFLLPETTSDMYFKVDVVLMIVLLAAYGLLLYKTRKKEQFEETALIKYLLYSLLVLFTFNPVYKYYVAGITPFLSLLVQKRRDIVAFEVFNFALLAIPRVLTSYLLLLLLAGLLRPCLGRTDRRKRRKVSAMMRVDSSLIQKEHSAYLPEASTRLSFSRIARRSS